MMKEYLGDSVYVELDSFCSVILTTENGYGPSNTIVLEPEVIGAFENYLARRVEFLRAESEKINGQL